MLKKQKRKRQNAFKGSSAFKKASRKNANDN